MYLFDTVVRLQDVSVIFCYKSVWVEVACLKVKETTMCGDTSKVHSSLLPGGKNKSNFHNCVLVCLYFSPIASTVTFTAYVYSETLNESPNQW